MKIRIALSGAEGSFSEEAARMYAAREGLDCALVFAIDMEGALQALDDGEADLGIFPVVNSRGGLVQSAYEAMGRHLFELKGELWMEVHQCLLARRELAFSDIRAVATHPQALSQCERFISGQLPQAELIAWDDTAKAARDLALGMWNETTAVIAPARCAELYGLTLIQKGIQDVHPNLTTFIIVSK